VTSLAHQLALQTVVASVPRLALSKLEAAQAIGVSVDFLEEHVLAELRVVRRGRRRLIPVKELERWLEQSASSLQEDLS
jgi:excisionase family DNA binding protein